ncbi:ATP-binding protein [Streptomyces violaceusniger]|uniref:ATP-binding protein n=1 Tax=Streptomyces violaceusniger TaxID=68280 RepID=UPI0037FBB478
MAWLRAPRPAALPGIWRCGHVPRAEQEPERVPTRQIAAGFFLSAFAYWLTFSLLWNGYLGWYWLWPFIAMIPDSWRGSMKYVVAAYAWYAVWLIGLGIFFGKLGRWGEALRRVGRWMVKEPTTTAVPGAPPRPSSAPPPPPHLDPAAFAHLRAAGAAQAADRLTAELRAGTLNDVDHARIERAWQSAGHHPERLHQFVQTVLTHGAAAFPHGSGARDLPVRTARHDLVAGQVLVGTAADTERNPWAYRTVGMALGPATLATSMVAVGPAAPMGRLLRPLVESVSLHALADAASLVVVTTAGSTPLAPDEAYDVVIRPGAATSTHGLDLYGGQADPDEAAGVVAEALVGDQGALLPGGDSRRAATALAQLLGPFRAAHGRFPTVRELRDLLDGDKGQLDALRRHLVEAGREAQARDLEAYVRQMAQPAVTMLAERCALLDRPAFDGFFTPEAGAAAYRPFSLSSVLEHPLRLRIDLPERGHAVASRIIARLVLAQFCDVAARTRSTGRFACLVMTDATQVVTPQSVRGLQRVGGAPAGAVLALPDLTDVPDHLRAPLLGAVGCRAALAGCSPWDGEHFAAAWGVEWVETRTVTAHERIADEPLTRALHQLRRLTTGRAVTRESVTVRREQRQRWSSSDLANDLPVGHAVISLTTTSGDRTPPILTTIAE